MIRNTILIVDDEEINRSILHAIFEKNYDIIEAEDGEQAMGILDEHNEEIVLVLLDLIMPKYSGIDVLEYMKEKGYLKNIPVIMITANATADTDFQAYEYGTVDVIYKPFVSKIVKKRGENAIELFNNRLNIEKQLEIKTRKLEESRKKLASSNEFLVNALSSVVEFRDTESGEHIKRVKSLTRVFLEALCENYPEYEFTGEQVDLIVNAAALHDLGKIAIPDNILLKPGRLTPEEFEIMKKHSIYGCELLERFKQEDSEFYQYCYDICRYHHEKYDGKGYPDGLVGEDIPIWAQVVSIVDVYDALVSNRVYKSAYAADTAFEMITNGDCGVFSPKLLHLLDVLQPKLLEITKTLSYDDMKAKEEKVKEEKAKEENKSEDNKE